MEIRSIWEGKNHPKMLLASWFLVYFLKRFRTLNAENLGSVSQRAAKLLAVKIGGLKKKSASRPRPQLASLPGFDSRSRSNHSQSLLAGNFAAIQPTDSKFLAMKDLNLLKKYIKNQEASSILRVKFDLSKWPHLHKPYLVTVQEYLSKAVTHDERWRWMKIGGKQ